MSKAGAGDKMAAGIVMGGHVSEFMPAPRMIAEVACYGPEGERWRDGFSNIVPTGGLSYLINRVFATRTSYTAGYAVWPHSASVNSTLALGNVSTARLGSFGNDVPMVTFTSSASQVLTQTVSYNFSASTQTCSGLMGLFYTSASMSTNGATGDMVLYNIGTFAASRLIESPATLNCTVSLSLGTA